VKKYWLLIVVSPLLLAQQCPQPDTPDTQPTSRPIINPRVTVETTQGKITLELFDFQAPLTVKNFLRYVREGYYDNTIIHQVDSGGIRGGKYNDILQFQAGYSPIANESANGLSNCRAYIAMILQSGAESATTEWIIYTTDQMNQDYVMPPNEAKGRTVFGRVIDGMGVVDTITQMDTITARTNDGVMLTLPDPYITMTVRKLDENGNPIPPSGVVRPTITCPPTAEAEPTGELTQVDIGQAAAFDAQGNPLTPTNNAPAAGFPKGSTVVTWTVFDADGNEATCQQTVNVPPLITTASGLQYQDFVVGTGDQPTPTSTVTVNYTGTLLSGEEFDSGDAVQFPLNGVIPGFTEGVGGMRVGGTRRMILPPDLAYGPEGNPPTIPPSATLIFMVDLLSIDD